MPSMLHWNISKLERKQEKHPLNRSANVMEGDGECDGLCGGMAAVVGERQHCFLSGLLLK